MANIFSSNAPETVSSGKKHIVDFLDGNFKDISRTNLFAIRIQGPITFNESEQDIMATSVVYPRAEVSTTEINRMGRKLVIPMTPKFEPSTITFLDDMGGALRNKFWDWHRLFYSDDIGAGKKKEDYSSLYGTIQIFQLDLKHKVTSGMILENAWPVSIGETTLDSNSTDNLITIPVSFNYSYSKFTNNT